MPQPTNREFWIPNDGSFWTLPRPAPHRPHECRPVAARSLTAKERDIYERWQILAGRTEGLKSIRVLAGVHEDQPYLCLSVTFRVDAARLTKARGLLDQGTQMFPGATLESQDPDEGGFTAFILDVPCWDCEPPQEVDRLARLWCWLSDCEAGRFIIYAD